MRLPDTGAASPPVSGSSFRRCGRPLPEFGRTSMKQTSRERMAAWTEENLQRAFNRYNAKYWRGRLPGYRIVIEAMPEAMGLCDSRRKIITVDVLRHKNRRGMRSTLLHEMAHAAADIRGSQGHDLKFFAEIEKLLRMRAPVAVETAEAGDVHILANLVPFRFPLLKRKIDKLEARRRSALEKLISERDVPTTLITDNDILDEFEDAAMELTWKQAVRVVGIENGLIDETGRPLDGRARRLLNQAKPRHARVRRNFLEMKRSEREIGRLSPVPSVDPKAPNPS